MYSALGLGAVVFSIILFLFLHFFSIVGYSGQLQPTTTTSSESSVLPMRNVTIGNTAVQVEVASTDAERQQGLSGRASLQEGKGMLFVFAQAGDVGFWMKDMQFPLDIIFADASGVVTAIARDASPGSYPSVFRSSATSLYVLEVPAGFTDAHAIAVGSKIVLQ